MSNFTQVLKAYKTKLRPTRRQARYFFGCAGAARYVFNWALADRKATFEAGGKPNKFEQKRRFNAIKDELCPWIREYPYKLAEAEFDHVDKAYQNFFRRIKSGKVGKEAGFPKFKNRFRDHQSFTLRDSIRVENGRIRLPIIGWVNLAEKDYIPENVSIKFATVSLRAGCWFISVQVEEQIEAPETNGHIVGVDVGIKSTAVLSDGRTFEAPKTLYKYEKRMARLQRELHRRKKGSANRTKTKARISKLHRKIADTRAHHLHNVSKAVVASFPRAVVIEDLNIKGMLKNGRLAKALSDAGMGELHRQIAYKSEWSGAELIEAGRFFASSRLCHKCGWYHEDLTLADRTYKCGGCGNEIDRDLNAAKNLAAYGEAVKRGGLPVELDGLPSTVKQEGGR
jgi:putative transposase